MTVKDLPVDVLAHLIRDVFLPVINVAADLDRDRGLAVATLKTLQFDGPKSAQLQRIRAGQLKRSVLPHYVQLHEHFLQYQSEFEAWLPVTAADLVNALRRTDDTAVLYEDSVVVRSFIFECQNLLQKMSARLKELTY